MFSNNGMMLGTIRYTYTQVIPLLPNIFCGSKDSRVHVYVIIYPYTTCTCTCTCTCIYICTCTCCSCYTQDWVSPHQQRPAEPGKRESSAVFDCRQRTVSWPVGRGPGRGHVQRAEVASLLELRVKMYMYMHVYMYMYIHTMYIHVQMYIHNIFCWKLHVHVYTLYMYIYIFLDIGFIIHTLCMGFNQCAIICTMSQCSGKSSYGSSLDGWVIVVCLHRCSHTLEETLTQHCMTLQHICIQHSGNGQYTCKCIWLIRARTHTHTHTHVHTHTHTHMHMHFNKHTHTHSITHSLLHPRHTHTCIYTMYEAYQLHRERR